MIEFREDTHQYFNDGKELISVTTLMKKHGLAPDYSFVDAEVLKQASERGSFIHKEIEVYNKTKEIGFSTEVSNYARYIDAKELNCLESEFIVHNDICAGTIDLILDDTKDIIIADIKTTSTLHKDAVSWQLSIYAYLYANQLSEDDTLFDSEKWYNTTKAQAFHFNKDGELNVVEIQLKKYKQVEDLMKAEREGFELYHLPQIELDENQMTTIEQAQALIEQADSLKKQADSMLNEIKDALIQAMQKNDVKAFENGRLKITYVAPVTKVTIDSAKLKKDLPDVAEKYSKSSTTKASVRITLKEQKDE